MRRELVVVAACAVVATACGTTTPGSPLRQDATREATSVVPAVTTTVSIPHTLTAPHPPPSPKNDGTTFDPCLAYTSDEISSWGVDPNRVHDKGNDGVEGRGCIWMGDGWSLGQSVINNPLEKYLQTDLFLNPHWVTVGGLKGVMYGSPATGDDACAVALPSQNATVHVNAGIYNEKTGRKAVPDLCAKALEVATFVVTKLPK